MKAINYSFPLLSEPEPKPSADQENSLSFQLLSAAFESLPDGLFLFDAERHLRFINRAGQRLQSPGGGWPVGRRCCEMFWNSNEDGRGCLVDRAVEEGRLVEVEMQSGPDSETNIILLVLPVQEENSRQKRSAIVIARDVSPLRRAQEAIFEQKAFRASLADRAPDEIYAIDTEGRISWMNARAETANMSPSGVLNRHFTEFVVPESRALVQELMINTLAGEDTNAEFRLERANRVIQDVEAYTSPLWKNGAVTGILVFLRDLTERKLIQQRIAHSEKLRAVGELAAGVTHNINNSLTIIQGNTQLLQRRTEDPNIRKGLNSIYQASLEAGQTLRRILDFARRENTEDFAPIDIAELVTSSVEISRPKWQRKEGNAINVVVETQDAPYTLGLLAEIREVVLNFIFNAVDAMPQGGTIEIGCRAEVDSACFWVADTGSGMTRETVARIFEPFYTTKGEKGTGLGLSASYGIIERHGGQIIVVSEPGEGTRFEVRLPLYDEAAMLSIHHSEAPARKRPTARVLFVADEGPQTIK
jgi:PAS domain S-box-containing protein